MFETAGWYTMWRGSSFDLDDAHLINDVNKITEAVKFFDLPLSIPKKFDIYDPFNDTRDIWVIEALLFLIQLFKKKEIMPLLLDLNMAYVADAIKNNKEHLFHLMKHTHSMIDSFDTRYSIKIRQSKSLDAELRVLLKKAALMKSLGLKLFEEMIYYSYKSPRRK